MPCLRCLPRPSPDDYSEAQKIYHGICVVRRILECAGHAFHAAYEKPQAPADGRDAYGAAAASGEPPLYDVDADVEEDEKWDAKHKNRAKQGAKQGGGGTSSGAPTRLKKLVDGPNLYSVLGVHETCSVETIKRAYRKMALQYHPDKKKARENLVHELTVKDKENIPTQQRKHCDVAEPLPSLRAEDARSDAPAAPAVPRPRGLEKYTDQMMFLLIQEAYDALSDPVFRRQYDSALPFDESIPTAADVDASDPQSFFRVFAPVFQANARWSVRKPVPRLGNLTTKMSEVHRFYQFWWRFETTREFSMHDEYDTADAECREERRWMERQNMKIRRKYIKEDKLRLTKLTDLAYSLDPRIAREKEEERQKREELKGAKRRAAESKLEEQRAEESRRRQEEEVRERERLEHERQRVQERQRIKAQLKQNRQELRCVCEKAIETNRLSADVLQDTCLTLPSDQLTTLTHTLKGFGDDAESLRRLADEIERFVADFKAQVPEHVTGGSPLTGVNPKPSGTSAAAGDGASQKTSVSSPALESSWSAEELSLLAKGVQKYPGGTPRRWQLIADMVGTKTVKAVLAKTKELADGTSLKSMGSSINKAGLQHHIQPTPTPPFSAHQPEPCPASSASTNHAAGSTASTTPDAPAAPAAAPTTWTQTQQKALEAALKSHRGQLSSKEHWTAIARDVPGRTAKECLARFKEVRAAIQASSLGSS